MLSLDVLLAFVVIACGFMLIPGPAMIYMATVGVDRGRNAGLAAAVGLAVGDLVLASAAALGLTAVLAASETLFLAFKVCGVGYLVWLGVRRLLTPMEPLDAAVPDGSPGRSRARWGEMGRGFLVSLANPKDALFFVALLPQFATATSGQGQGQMLLLGRCSPSSRSAATAATPCSPPSCGACWWSGRGSGGVSAGSPAGRIWSWPVWSRPPRCGPARRDRTAGPVPPCDCASPSGPKIPWIPTASRSESRLCAQSSSAKSSTVVS